MHNSEPKTETELGLSFTEGDPNLSVLRVRTVPYRFPRGTFLFDRTAYRTFVTVFRDLNIKKFNLMEFIRKARTVQRSVFI